MRAYEMFATGARKTEIARECGVTKTTVTNWSRDDRWEQRLADVVSQANAAADHAVGEELAQALAQLKRQARKRIMELELLCGPSAKPETRIRAIQLWLKLAGLDRAIPTPTDPASPRSLELIEDLLTPEGM
jgi:transposase-like protein